MTLTSIIQKKYYHVNNIDQTEYSNIVWERKEKIDQYDLLKKESCSDKSITEVLKVSRASIFRWKKQYKIFGLIGLEKESTRPNNVRKSAWTKEIENRIYHLRKQYSIYGKAKIAVFYKNQYKEQISVSMVGRVIRKLIKHEKVYPVKFLLYKKITKNREFNGHAKRWQRGMKAIKPGELMQFDHMTIQVPGHGQLKNFSAICPVTKVAVQKVYKEANSRNGADFLRYVITQLPFPIISIQVDGGGEFMKDFEHLCERSGIPLFVLPPYSPEYNCYVERGNGTFKYEFYGQYDTVRSFDLLQKDLQKFVGFYNRERPHHGVNLLTPYQSYAMIKAQGGQSQMS